MSRPWRGVLWNLSNEGKCDHRQEQMTDKQMLNIISALQAKVFKCQEEIAKLRAELLRHIKASGGKM